METGLDPGARFMVDDLLNFTLDAGDKTLKTPSSSSSLESSNPDPHHHQSLSFPEEIAEEELEWLSNKDAFPAVETCLDILSDNPGIVLNHNSPVSVLENSTTSTSNSTTTITSCCGGGILVPVRYPVKARSKRPRRGFFFRLTQSAILVEPSKFQEYQTRIGTSSSTTPKCHHNNWEKVPALPCGEDPTVASGSNGAENIVQCLWGTVQVGEACARVPPCEQSNVFELDAFKFSPESNGDEKAEANGRDGF